jgi:beta-lactamase regulating signal transducer with metallopeptidase domain
MTLDAELVSGAVRLALNLMLVGAPVALAVALALGLTWAARPRARYALAVAAFALAAVAPVAATLARPEPPEPPAVVTTGRPAERPLVDRLAAVLASTSFGPALVAVWVAGAAVLLAREAIGHVRLARARRRWRRAGADLARRLDWPGDVTLFVGERDGPCAVGLVRGAVVLPAALVESLGPEAARSVARHELAHARWRDPLANAALRAARAALWVSPPLWLLERVVRAEREAAADAFAVGGGAADDYATTLVEVARRAAHTPAGLPMGGAGLERRVARLIGVRSRAPRARATAAAAVLAGGLAGAALVPKACPVPVGEVFEIESVARASASTPEVATGAADAAGVGAAPRAGVRRVVAREVIAGAAPPKLPAPAIVFPGDGVDLAGLGASPIADYAPESEETVIDAPPPPPDPVAPARGAADESVHVNVHRHVDVPEREVKRIVIRTRS